jgi:virulence factor Mce-like protein
VRRLDSKRLALELRRSIRPLALYLFLIAAGLLSAGIIFKNQTFQKPWEHYRQVRASFDDVKGVVPGSQQVRIAGVPVGVIKKVDLDRGRAILTLSIKQQYGRLYRDARMRLRPATPLQDMYVDVRRGTPQAGVLDEDDVLPAERTETPVDISRVMNTFDRDTRQRLGVLLEGLGKGLDDRGASLHAAFAEAVPFLEMATRTSSVVARRRAAARRVISNLNALTGVLARRNRQIAGVVDHGEATLGELARNDGNLAATIRELPPTLTAMRASFASLRSAEDELDPALGSLDPVLTNLDSGLQALQRFGTGARPALAALRAPVRSLRPLARHLRPTATALRSAMESLDAQTADFGTITELMVPCRRAMEAFFNNTMSIAKFDDQGGTVPRAEATVSTDTLTPLAPGPVPVDPSFEKKPTCTPGGQAP